MDKIENHLNYNPWLRGIYDEAKRIAASDPGAALGDGLDESDLSQRAQTIRCGDKFDPGGYIHNEITAVPEAYFAFLFIIGGFNCRSVQLYHLGKEYLFNEGMPGYTAPNVVGPSVRESISTGESRWNHARFPTSFPIQIILGKCDHGDYVYDRRYDSYSLISSDHTTPFNNCTDMLNHALYRARENINENWKETVRDSALVGSWLLTGVCSCTFYPDGKFASHSRGGRNPSSRWNDTKPTWSTEGNKVINTYYGEMVGSARYKIKGKGAEAKLTITNDKSVYRDGYNFIAGTYNKQESGNDMVNN